MRPHIFTMNPMLWIPAVAVSLTILTLVKEKEAQKPDTFTKKVYDITDKKNALISANCDNNNSNEKWNLTSVLYWRIGSTTVENKLATLQFTPNLYSQKECQTEHITFDYGIFFDTRRLCDIRNMTGVTIQNILLEGNITVIVKSGDQNYQQNEQNCAFLCKFLICTFQTNEKYLGIDVDLSTFLCVYSSCSYVFKNIGFIVVNIRLNKISTMLSYGGFERIMEAVRSKHNDYWLEQNPLMKLHYRLTLDSSTGLNTNKLDKIKTILQEYSSFWMLLSWNWRDLVILESSKTYKHANSYEDLDHSKNSTVHPRIELNGVNNLRNISSLCYFWHMLTLAAADFKQFYLPVDRWESTELLVEEAETLCGVNIDPKTSILVFGKQNQYFVEHLRNRTTSIDYNFPVLIFLVAEKPNNFTENVVYVRTYEIVHNQAISFDKALSIPTFILLNNTVSGQENLTPILPKLDALLKLTKNLKNSYNISDAMFFIEFNITDQSKSILGADRRNAYFKSNLFCWDDLIEMKEVQEGLMNWAHVNNFKVIPFPVVDTEQNLGWTYDVITMPALKKDKTNLTVTIKRNTPNYMGVAGGAQYQSCIDKCVAYVHNCEADFTGDYYSGVTLNLDEHSKFVQLSDTNIKKFLVLAFLEFEIVEVMVNDVKLVESVFRVLNYDLRKEIAHRTQREVENIMLYMSIYGGTDTLISTNIAGISGFSPKGISFKNWETNGNMSQTFSNHSFGVGIQVQDCTSEINSGLDTIKTHPLFPIAGYIICPIDGYLDPSFIGNEEQFQKFLDTYFFIRKYFQLSHNKETYFRISFNITCISTSNIESFHNFKRYLQDFAFFSRIHYYIGDVFINCSEYKIINYSDLLNVTSYIYLENTTSKQHPKVPLFDDPPANQTIRSSNMPLIIGVPVLSVFTIAAISFVYIYFRNTRLKVLSREEIDAFLDGEDIEVTSESIIIPYVQINMVKSLGFNKVFSIAKQDVLLGNPIGEGHFGNVFKAIYRKHITVAVKLPRPDCSKEAFKTMLSEVKILSYLGEHDHVLRFIGSYTNEIDVGLIYIVTEFCENGTLQEHLKSLQQKYSSESNYSSTGIGAKFQETDDTEHVRLLSNSLANEWTESNEDIRCCINPKPLCQYAKEIASGMEYISSKKVVHSDLSTRNVLLTEKNACKIAEFGLSRKLYERTAYIKQGKEALPWRWMAIESLNSMEFTTKSDIWSYGVTIWEIFTLGDTPYSGMVWSPGFINQLEEGLRLPKPKAVSDEIFEKVSLCWNTKVDDRPTFVEMEQFFYCIGHRHRISSSSSSP